MPPLTLIQVQPQVNTRLDTRGATLNGFWTWHEEFFFPSTFISEYNTIHYWKTWNKLCRYHIFFLSLRVFEFTTIIVFKCRRLINLFYIHGRNERCRIIVCKESQAYFSGNQMRLPDKSLNVLKGHLAYKQYTGWLIRHTRPIFSSSWMQLFEIWLLNRNC